MDPWTPHDSSPHQMPRSLPESGTQSMSIFDTSVHGDWLSKEPTEDSNGLSDFYFCSSEPGTLEWPEWNLEAQDLTIPEKQHHSVLQSSGLSQTLRTEDTESPANLAPLSNVSQWLNGAYRPPVPCTHCRRHRLQCLIIRTTPANPNPITSCSSCVALFRECSLSKGEKRQPSRFETFSPVLGHLHGLPEQMEDGMGSQPELWRDINLCEKQSTDVPAQDGNAEERRESKQFVRKGARVLREWFYQHQEYPYPNDNQKAQLCRETGFSQKRISTWFANARRRQKQKLQSSNLPSASHPRAGSPLITSTLQSMTPMERWKASPPEDEPAPGSAIQDAIASSTTETDVLMDPFHFDVSTMDLFNFEETSSHLASSVSSFGSRTSETSESTSSAWSYHSGSEGVMSFPLLPKAQRSRRRGRPRLSGDEGQYQCTFCIQSFRKRHDWARHEKSVHLPLDSWVCTPDLSELDQRYTSQPDECCFCNAPFPASSHWEEHEFHICAAKPVTERSFTRKDYLWQHLRKFHACTKLPIPDLDAWRGSGATVQSRCGFCDCSLSDWAARAEHLAAHFKNGARMQQWVGDWGLDSTAMSILRNATLPTQRSLASESIQ